MLRDHGEPVLAEVVALGRQQVTCLPLGDTTGLGVGALVEDRRGPLPLLVGHQLLGRVLDGLAAFCRYWRMTPAEVDALDDDTYLAFVRFMSEEAKAIQRAQKRRR